jgi:hypothetical protein
MGDVGRLPSNMSQVKEIGTPITSAAQGGKWPATVGEISSMAVGVGREGAEKKRRGF